MIDLHCHILPGVDDGSASEEESCMMARLAVDSGVTAVAATPHCNVPGQFENVCSETLRRRFLRLHELLREQEIPLKLYTGMEVYMTPEVPRLLRQGKLLTLGGSRYLLVEFGFDESRQFAQRMLDALRGEGVTPVIAHPERYHFVQRERECLLRWADEGYALQINKGSLFGMFGSRAAHVANWCLGEGCLHLIGSDAHSPFRRTTRLADAWDYAADCDSPEIADFLLEENPSRILRDLPVQPVLAAF
ncbi:tyrosine-protein phosphatase [uncultured Dysosmobacter sp.]|uniref:tyrosine-protein phosphatase n=1 Tax=uncultured Dysosmobacter sp. TaxID=2591384 RepID=UPI002671518C|nr:CpsB/CapC family capsule biosynthesis tyrosine phosphatase [uncultured Dysosmobacter sp.]